MTAVVIIFSILCLAIAVVAARRRHFLLPANENVETNFRAPLKTASLFAPDAAALAAKIENEKRQRERREERERTLAWASLIDFSQLPEFKNIADEKLRRDALDILTERAKTNEDVCALVEFVLANRAIEANKRLVRAFQTIWKLAPNRSQTINLLQLATEFNDADLFLETINDAEYFIRSGALHGLKANELRALASSHYWLLNEQARISGAGFMLKQKLHESNW